MTSAAITIIQDQVKFLLGLHNIPRNFTKSTIAVFKHINETNLADLAWTRCLRLAVADCLTVCQADALRKEIILIASLSRRLMLLTAS